MIILLLRWLVIWISYVIIFLLLFSVSILETRNSMIFFSPPQDHVVPLKEAWVSGARTWTNATRQAFANDLTRPQLIAVTDSYVLSFFSFLTFSSLPSPPFLLILLFFLLTLPFFPCFTYTFTYWANFFPFHSFQTEPSKGYVYT